MKTQKISFKNKNNEILSAKLELPLAGKPVSCALFAHCFTCSKNLNAVTNISRALTGNNIAVLRFDFTGLGESEGDFSDTNFSSNVDDIIAAANYMEENFNSPAILIGHSLGGAAVLAAAYSLPQIKAVVTIGAPFHPEHIQKHFKNDIDEINQKGEATIAIGGRPFKIKKQFIDDVNNISIKEKIKDLGKGLLILHSPQDTIVEIENAALIYRNASHPKSFIALEGADHLLTRKEDSLYVGEVIASWVKRYINLPQKKSLTSNKQVVTRIGKG